MCSIFSNFSLDYGLLLELHALTLAAQSYVLLSSSCIEQHTYHYHYVHTSLFSIDYLFLNASARDDMKYTIYFYNVCSNDTRPQMWIGAAQDQYVLWITIVQCVMFMYTLSFFFHFHLFPFAFLYLSVLFLIFLFSISSCLSFLVPFSSHYPPFFFSFSPSLPPSPPSLPPSLPS